MTFFQKFYFFLTLFLLKVNYPAVAETKSFIPNAPIINFRLPIFSQEGYQSWYIHGDQGIYVNDNEVEVIGMQLNIFSGDKKSLLEVMIESPKATFWLHENRVTSEHEIQATGSSYSLSGKDWNWDGKFKKIIINQDVKVVFDQPLTNLLTNEKK